MVPSLISIKLNRGHRFPIGAMPSVPGSKNNRDVSAHFHYFHHLSLPFILFNYCFFISLPLFISLWNPVFSHYNLTLHLFPSLYRFQLSLNSFPTFVWHSKWYSPLLVADKRFPCLEDLKRIKKRKRSIKVRKKYRDIYNCISTSLTTLLCSAILYTHC